MELAVELAVRLAAGRIAAGALLLTAVLTGCAGSPDPDPAPAAPPPTSSAPGGPSGPTGPGRQSAPSAPAQGEPLPLQVAFAQPDPRQLVVQVVAAEACPAQQVRYQLTETTKRVSVRLTTTGTCAGESGPRNVEIPLAQPLGDRELVDATSGVPVQVAIGTPPGPPVPTVSAEPG